MEPEFWHQRWAENDIGFHEAEANTLLVKHFHLLGVDEGSRIFLPLCGKTRDIAWLLSNGYQVVGIELSEVAIKELFADLEIIPEISQVDKLKRYSGQHIEIYVGDIFDLSSEVLGSVDAIYDRAALVALPTEIRNRYSVQVQTITNRSPQLLICFEYNQSLMSGPPFSINADEVTRQYDNSYHFTLVESIDVIGGLKGKCPAQEHAWILKND